MHPTIQSYARNITKTCFTPKIIYTVLCLSTGTVQNTH